MKKLALTLAAVLMLTALLAVGVSAAGITIPNKDVTYVASKVTDAVKTYEAVVQIDKSVTGRAGVILGNYNSGVPCISFEVHNNGVPRLYAHDSTGKVNNLDIKFDKVDLRSDKPVHVAVVFDTAKKQAHCYLDGVLKQSLDYTAKGYVVESTGNVFYVGGDPRSGNAQYFKGEIYSVAAYSDERSADTIKKDAAVSGIVKDDAALLLAYDFTVGGKARLQDLSKNDNDLKYTGPEVPEPETTKAPAVTQKQPTTAGSSAATFDAAVILSAVTAIAASGVVVLKKKH